LQSRAIFIPGIGVKALISSGSRRGTEICGKPRFLLHRGHVRRKASKKILSCPPLFWLYNKAFN